MGRDVRWDNVNEVVFEILMFIESFEDKQREAVLMEVTERLDKAQREGKINIIERASALDILEKECGCYFS